jgi:tRNA pseudouridine55 synthase
VKIRTKVSSGTYIRSLAEDIGEALGTGAYLSALRRTQVGKFDIKNALKLSSLSYDELLQHLQNRGGTANIEP